ncbi:MAG: RsmD family RNA methyltransferase [Fuerstiella sp.]
MALRIIGGEYRRRILRTPPGKATRPYTDRVRQIVFDRLGEDVVGARVADVFSGVGTMGMESLSRGASSCVFIEGDPIVHAALAENVSLIVVDQPTVCWKTDIHRTSFCPKNVDECLPYSLIYFDPPYDQCPLLKEGDVLGKALARLAKPRASTDDAVVVLRTPEHFDFQETEAWKIQDVWRISTMNIWILRKPGCLPAKTDEEEQEISETGPAADEIDS